SSSDEDRNIERRALGHVADVKVARVAPRRHRAVLPRLRASDAHNPWERRQRNLDPRREFSDLALEIEVEILDLPFWKLARKLAEHAGHVEVRAIGARHDLVDADLEHVSRLGTFDIDRPGQRMRSTAGEIGTQFLDLLDRRSGHDLLVRV